MERRDSAAILGGIEAQGDDGRRASCGARIEGYCRLCTRRCTCCQSRYLLLRALPRKSGMPSGREGYRPPTVTQSMPSQRQLCHLYLKLISLRSFVAASPNSASSVQTVLSLSSLAFEDFDRVLSRYIREMHGVFLFAVLHLGLSAKEHVIRCKESLPCTSRRICRSFNRRVLSLIVSNFRVRPSRSST